MPCSAEIEPPAAVTRSSTIRVIAAPSASYQPGAAGFPRGRGSGCCRRRDGRSRWRSAGEGALDLGGGVGDETGHVGDGDGNIVRERRPSARSASEMESRIRQKASAWDSFAAITASPIRPGRAPRRAMARARRRCRVGIGGRGLDQHMPGKIARQRRTGAGDVLSTSSSESAGTISNPSIAVGAPLEEAQQRERARRGCPRRPRQRRARRSPGPGATQPQ